MIRTILIISLLGAIYFGLHLFKVLDNYTKFLDQIEEDGENDGEY